MFKKVLSIVFVAVLISIFSGCTTVNYTGPAYTPTKKVEIFYDKSNIKKPYDVMGKAVASTWYSYDNTSLRPALVEKAKACGADAILIDSIDETISEPARINSDSEIDDGKMAANNPTGKTAGDMIIPDTDGDQTTESVDTSQIVAEFLKFKK